MTLGLRSDVAIGNAENEVYEAEEGRSDVDKRSAHEVVQQESLSIITKTSSVVNGRTACTMAARRVIERSTLYLQTDK